MDGSWRGRSRWWWPVSVLGAGAGLVAVGAATQRVVDRTVDRLPSRGHDLDVGGRTVHVEVWGRDDPDAPTVVAETGVGGTAADWERVGELVDGDIRLVAVDRPGLGRSAAGPAPGVDTTVGRIEAVLAGLGGRGPVVLAGWSMGGLLALGVAMERPDLVAGMVLVDPSHPDEARRFNDPALNPIGRTIWRGVGLASRLGGAAVAGIPSRLAYLRWFGDLGREPRWQVATFARSTAGAALASEMLAFPGVCDEVGGLRAAAASGRRRVPVVPTVLLSASRRRNDRESDTWAELHDDLASWVAGTELLVVEGAGHDVLWDRPEVVASAIGRVVEAWRHGDPTVGPPPVPSPG